MRSVCAGAMSVVLLLLPSAILRPHYAPGSCTAATTRRSTIPAMVSDQQRHNSYKGAKAAAQKFIDSGEAATVEEALRLHAASVRAAYDAKYSTEEQSVMGRKAKEAAGKKLIASGKAATLEEAYTLLGRRGAEAMAQKLVDLSLIHI